jgi:phosphohistidine phosphatase
MTDRFLLLARHAKSAWDEHDAQDDHQRPLNDRGQHDAPRVGAWLGRHEWFPDLVLSSDALRAQQTWALMAPDLAPDLTPSWRPELYLASPAQIIATLSEADDAHKTVLALGHNPGWELLAAQLCGKPMHMTTGNVAILHGHGDTWAQALAGTWTLKALVRPKEIE